MRYFIWLVLLFQHLALLLPAQNTLSVISGNAEAGQTFFLEIEVINSQSFVAFQFDLTYDKSAFTFNKTLSALTDRKDGHSLSLSEPQANLIRAISYSASQKSFKGNSGTIIKIAFQCGSQKFGSFPFTLSGAILANSQSQNILNQTINGNIIIGTTQIISLSQGWTWFSVNMDPGSWEIAEVLKPIIPVQGDYIKDQTVSAAYYEGYGWFGELKVIDPKMMYKIKLSGSATLSVFGAPVDPAVYPVSIRAGWNWIGYLPQTQQFTQNVLSSINPVADDYIKNQTESSTYYAGFGWFGGLNQLKPGDGYMLKTSHAGTLVYASGVPLSVKNVTTEAFGHVSRITLHDPVTGQSSFLGVLSRSCSLGIK